MDKMIFLKDQIQASNVSIGDYTYYAQHSEEDDLSSIISSTIEKGMAG